MRITVTKEDIKNGRKGERSSCPVAIALKRELNRSDLYVMTCVAHIGNDTCLLSSTVKSFIKRFDKGSRVKPFSFNIKYKP